MRLTEEEARVLSGDFQAVVAIRALAQGGEGFASIDDAFAHYSELQPPTGYVHSQNAAYWATATLFCSVALAGRAAGGRDKVFIGKPGPVWRASADTRKSKMVGVWVPRPVCSLD